MKILFEHKNTVLPRVSVILLDWSCRESFHTLGYLSKQTVAREQYEIIWIEYYHRCSPEIAARLEKCKGTGSPPEIDQWIVLEMPENVYYHKHLMYNVGILASRGEIVVMCDSDALMKPTFIESVIKAFEQDPEIVLHLDEVRNTNRKFHPFKYPSFEEILGEGCINWRNGKTTGVLDHEDPVHTRNYGACMCALRKDLINIGGADEHKHYLGHICGPYELTFRLMNAGKKEMWHQEEFLYHVWHPGTDGWGNYLGPHDGFNMSNTALKLLRSGRREPLLENPAIKTLRAGGDPGSLASLFSQVIPVQELRRWKISKLEQAFFEFTATSKKLLRKLIEKRKSWRALIPPEVRSLFFRLLIHINLLGMSFKQAFFKSAVRGENKVMPKNLFFKLQLVFVFLSRMWKNNVYVFRACRQLIEEIMQAGAREVALCGVNDATEIIRILLRERRVKLAGIYVSSPAKNHALGREVLPLQEIKGYRGKIIVASFLGVKEKIRALEELGIDKSNILRLL